MKKTVFVAAASLLVAGMSTACGSKENKADTAVVAEEEVVGEVVDMPAGNSAPADTVIAAGEAVAVDTAAPAR